MQELGPPPDGLIADELDLAGTGADDPMPPAPEECKQQ